MLARRKPPNHRSVVAKRRRQRDGLRMEVGMKQGATPAIGILLLLATFADANGASQDKFQKLSGPQIRAKLLGMEITDEAHWADVFAVNGTLTSYSMSRKKAGTWRVQKDELCIDRGDDD